MSDPTDMLPITVLVPESIAFPIEVYDQHAALRIGIVDRAGAHNMDHDWDEPGVYLLLYPRGGDGTWPVYVGKAPAGIRSRIGQHLKGKQNWIRAVVIRRDTTFGFNSAQVGWLEGRLYDLMDAAEDATLTNKNRPSDETLPAYDRQMLEAVVLPVSRVLRLIGYDPTTADDSADQLTKQRTRTSRFYGITVKHLIDTGLVLPGATVVSTNGAWPASGTVLDDGQIQTGGKTYSTPSAAAAAIKGGAANGWDFWAVETPTGNLTLATLRARYLQTQKASQTEVGK